MNRLVKIAGWIKRVLEEIRGHDLPKVQEERKDFLTKSLQEINQIGYELQPFLPETAEKILKATQGKITKISPLFPRLSK